MTATVARRPQRPPRGRQPTSIRPLGQRRRRIVPTLVAARLASGKPSAARAKISRSARLLIMVRFVVNTVALTVRRDTLTSLPERNVGFAMDLAQRQHGETDRPKTEAPDADLALRNHAGVLERVAQVRVREADELVEALLERGRRVQLLEAREVEVAARKHRARQPACVRLPVVPDVLQDVRHLQPLAERDGEAHQRLALLRDLRTMQAEELRAHLAHDAGDEVAIGRELREVCRDRASSCDVETPAYPRHMIADAASKRILLRDREAVRHADHGRRVAHEIALVGQHALGQQGQQRGRERLSGLCRRGRPRRSARGTIDFCAASRPMSSSIVSARRQSRYAFVMTSARRSRQHRNRQCERSRDPGKNACLVCEIVGGRARVTARFGVHECLRRARRFGVTMARYDSTGLEGRVRAASRSLPQAESMPSSPTILRCDDHVPARLRDAMQYSVLGGGKRVRPLLVYASGELCGVRRGRARQHRGRRRARPRLLARARRSAGDGR